ncbi:MAG: protein phosphatase 2C domain-containing protein [Phycisphaerae bacterium]
MKTPRIASAINRGRRENLEDALAAFHFRLHQPGDLEVTWMVACDGVGGEQFGEVASALAIRHIGWALTGSLLDIELLTCAPVSPDSILAMLCQAIKGANEAVLEEAARRGVEGMATTAVCTIVIHDMLFVVSAGDSRCYVYTAKGIRQITRDHSETQDLIDAGLLDPWGATFHPLAHYINRYLGQREGFLPDTRLCPLATGDIVLISTDGMTDVLSADDMAAMVRDYRRGVFPFDELPDRLVQAALAAGTTDNVSVLCYEHPSRSPADEPYLSRTLTASYASAVARTLQNPM